MRKAKWIWAVVVLIGVVGCIFGVYEFYCYQNPNVIITYRVQESEDLYLSLLSYAIASS